MIDLDDELKAEAQAFTNRISERVNEGFVPDLRNAVKCDYFYKSFWRDPQFIDLYLGEINKNYLHYLDKYCGKGLKILDVGCGAGYMSLELARNGHHVVAIDISEGCIQNARKTLEQNTYVDGFGSLEYKKIPLDDVDGEYDVVLFSVSLHHFPDVEGAVKKSKSMLRQGGHLLCYEPCHERFLERDAAFVTLIRGLLSITGHWFDQSELAGGSGNDDEMLAQDIRDIKAEYFWERDKDEPDGQSPNDLEASGDEMLMSLRRHFTELEVKPGFSFIYRVLGGLRGDDETVRHLADFIASFDRVAVSNRYINENHFYYIGRNDG